MAETVENLPENDHCSSNELDKEHLCEETELLQSDGVGVPETTAEPAYPHSSIAEKVLRIEQKLEDANRENKACNDEINALKEKLSKLDQEKISFSDNLSKLQHINKNIQDELERILSSLRPVPEESQKTIWQKGEGTLEQFFQKKIVKTILRLISVILVFVTSNSLVIEWSYILNNFGASSTFNAPIKEFPYEHGVINIALLLIASAILGAYGIGDFKD